MPPDGVTAAAAAGAAAQPLLTRMVLEAAGAAAERGRSPSWFVREMPYSYEVLMENLLVGGFVCVCDTCVLCEPMCACPGTVLVALHVLMHSWGAPPPLCSCCSCGQCVSRGRHPAVGLRAITCIGMYHVPAWNGMGRCDRLTNQGAASCSCSATRRAVVNVLPFLT